MFLYLFKYENNSPGEIRGIMRRMIRKSDKSNSWLTAFLSRENRPFPALVVRLSRPALPAPAKLLAPPASNEAVRKSMKGNKRSNTKPELLERERLRAAGLTGYRLQWKVPGHPDVAWPGKKVALFVNGCFWHRCPHCNLSLPKSNVEYWVVKFARNVERDEQSRAALEALGERFNPGQPESLEKEIAATWNSVCVLELEIEHLTGKEAKELRKRRAGQ